MAIIQNLEAFVQSYPAGLDSVTDLQLSQNENGRQIRFTIGGVTIPAGSVATISGTKPDGVVYSNTGTIEGADTVIFDEDVQMTAVFGTWYAKIRITNAGNTIASARVRFIIDKDPVDAGAIPSESQLDGLVAEAEEYAEAAGDAAERAAITYGSPLTASTAFAMTDINRVYVYTGSESGYTYGNWYYYNGSAWTSGGIYNSAAVETDTTLTESGVPADAKATGDKIDELKDDLTKTESDVYALNEQAPNATSTGWRLNESDGRCSQNSDYNMKKFPVLQGNLLKIISDDRFQFQNSATVPGATGTITRVGNTYGAGTFYLIVPDTATYLIVSTPANGSTAHVFSTISANERIDYINDIIDDIYIISHNMVDAINSPAKKWVNNTTGEIYDSTDALYAITDYLEVMPSTQYACARVVRVWYYDSSKTYISTSALNNSETGERFTTPANARYMIAGFNKSYYVNTVIITKNTTLPITYSPYFEPYVKPSTLSAFDKSSKINAVGIPVTGYYAGLGETYDLFTQNSLTSDVISAFDTLVTNYGTNYITKTDLGVSSDEVNHLYEYTLQPKVPSTPTANIEKQYPVILIVSAQHGFEKSSVYGLYYFVRDLLTKWDKNPVLDYIRNHVVLKIIPIANPYGFDNKVYDNANGVNLNRNYDTIGFPYSPTAEPGDSDYGGVEPFDQPETAIIRDWVENNTDAFMFIDFHTNGQGSVAEYERINWIAPPLAKDEYFAKLWIAGTYHIANITAHFANDYQLELDDDMCGYMTGTSMGESTVPTADVWVTNQNIIGLTFEGFNGFVGETAFNADEQKANSELIGNWIITALNTFAV